MMSARVCAVLVTVVALLTTFTSPVSAQPQPYNNTLAYQLLHMSGAAYCSGPDILAWKCSFCEEVPRFQPFGVAYNETTDMLAYVGYEPFTQTVIISFRGTVLTSILDWLEDLNFFQTEAICPACGVHEGFYEAYMSIRADFVKYVHLAEQAYPNSEIVITGHSLGGALAYLAAVDLSLNEGINVTTSYTFGQPRVGNTIFKDTWEQIFYDTATSFRVTHGLDPVPHLPPRLASFVHPPTEVYWDGLNTVMKICDGSGEDASCADQWLLPIGITDHLTYMGLDFMAKWLSCAL